jgi:peroxiredoxin
VVVRAGLPSARSHGHALVLALVVATTACGGEATRAAERADARADDDDGLELSLVRHDGERIELADQRGTPVLLFFFATYDGASIASSRGVARFAREALDTVVIGVALQPDAPTFAAAYVETELPPYAIAYDDDEMIVQGRSDLGAFEAIPMFVMIDAHGREVARHVGYASERQLRTWHEQAIARGGIVAPTPAEPSGGESPADPAPAAAAPGDATPPTRDNEPDLADGDVVIEPE